MVGLDDLRGLFQPSRFHDSMVRRWIGGWKVLIRLSLPSDKNKVEYIHLLHSKRKGIDMNRGISITILLNPLYKQAQKRKEVKKKKVIFLHPLEMEGERKLLL